MKKEQLSDSLNMLHEDILEETNAIRNRKRKISGDWRKWGAAAAVLALTVYGGSKLVPNYLQGSLTEEGGKLSENSGALSDNPVDIAGDSGGGPEDTGTGGLTGESGNHTATAEGPGNLTDDDNNLPLLSVSGAIEGEMGFEGYMAYDVSELVNGNPWSEDMTVSTLPVYKNSLSYDENYIAYGADFTKMRQFLVEIAGRFGLEEESIVITDDVPDQETQNQIAEKFQSVGSTVPEGYFNPTRLMTEAEGLKIEVDLAMTAKITFEPAAILPEEYHFTHDASYEETSRTAGYLESQYQPLIGMENPSVNIYGGDYNIYFQQSYHIEFYNGEGSDIDKIQNYNFNRTAFYCNDEGKLYLARVFRPDLSQKMGDYPIITLKEAEKLLAEGDYITTVPCEMPGADYVKKAELIYRTGEREKYFMPYYCFYVELPEMEREGGLKTYGVYYVPAVEGRYLTDTPAWDGGADGLEGGADR